MMAAVAYAMGSPGGAPPEGGLAVILVNLFPLILIFVIFYFLLIRPQQKKAREHQKMLENLKKGDKVVTNGGLHGTIVGLTLTVVTLQVADNVRVKVDRSAIARLREESEG